MDGAAGRTAPIFVKNSNCVMLSSCNSTTPPPFFLGKMSGSTLDSYNHKEIRRETSSARIACWIGTETQKVGKEDISQP